MRAEQEEEQEPVKTVTQTTYEALLERQSYFFHIDSANETEEDFLEDESKKEDAYIHDYARPRKYIIKQNSKFKFWFDMMIISLASFNVFTIPFIIAFDPPEANSWWYSTIVWLINIIFVIDIIINFRTTFINNRTGDEVWEPKMIAKRYLLGPKFWIDLLSALPLDQIISKGILRDSFSLLGMLKAVRVMRLSTVIQSLNIRQDYKAYLKLVKLVFYLTIYIHFIA